MPHRSELLWERRGTRDIGVRAAAHSVGHLAGGRSNHLRSRNVQRARRVLLGRRRGPDVFHPDWLRQQRERQLHVHGTGELRRAEHLLRDLCHGRPAKRHRALPACVRDGKHGPSLSDGFGMHRRHGLPRGWRRPEWHHNLSAPGDDDAHSRCRCRLHGSGLGRGSSGSSRGECGYGCHDWSRRNVRRSRRRLRQGGL